MCDVATFTPCAKALLVVEVHDIDSEQEDQKQDRCDDPTDNNWILPHVTHPLSSEPHNRPHGTESVSLNSDTYAGEVSIEH